MIVINIVWPVKPEFADTYPEHLRDFAEATRAEPGCLWFELSRNVDRPDEYMIVEAFRDQEALDTHLQAEHFSTYMATHGQYLARRPKIVRFEMPGDDWTDHTGFDDSIG